MTELAVTPTLSRRALLFALGAGLGFLVAVYLWRRWQGAQPGATAATGPQGESGPCYLCGEPGHWCPGCQVYKCDRHDNLINNMAGAVQKATHTGLFSGAT